MHLHVCDEQVNWGDILWFKKAFKAFKGAALLRGCQNLCSDSTLLCLRIQVIRDLELFLPVSDC